MSETPAVSLSLLQKTGPNRTETRQFEQAPEAVPLPTDSYAALRNVAAASGSQTAPPAANNSMLCDKTALRVAANLAGAPLLATNLPSPPNPALDMAAEEKIPAPPKPNGVPVVIPQLETIALTIPASDVMVRQRHGRILQSGILLKCDHFPTLHQSALQGGRWPQPYLDGAPNFRKLLGEPIYGTAQPTIQGIRNVLMELGAGPGSSGPPVLWINHREEPVVYVNNRSFNPRQQDNPFINLHNEGAPPRTVELTDEHLKQDVIDELNRHHGMTLIHDETADYKLFPQWLRVDSSSVKTPREVYEELRREGFNVKFLRIPVGDEMAPSEKAFDAMFRELKDVDPLQKIVDNCHGGRGRTTTGMVIADMVRRVRLQAATGTLRGAGLRHDITEKFNNPRNDYRPILNLIRALEEGPQAATGADKSIDRSDSLQNLRGAVQDYRDEMSQGKSDEEREGCRVRCRDYLRRYYYLLAAEMYLKDQLPVGLTQSFRDWMDQSVMRQVLKNVETSIGVADPPQHNQPPVRR